MSRVPYCIDIALIAVLAGRFVLDAFLGRAPLRYGSRGVTAVVESGIIWGMLTAGAAVAWLTAEKVLVPLGILHCYPLILVAAFVGLGLAAESLFSRHRPMPVLNRMLARAAAVSSMVGFLALVPGVSGDTHSVVPFMESLGAAALAGGTYMAVRLLYDGVMEGVVYSGKRRPVRSLARELLAAGLVALALGGISSMV